MADLWPMCPLAPISCRRRPTPLPRDVVSSGPAASPSGRPSTYANMMYKGLRNYDHSNLTDEQFLMKACPLNSCHAGEGEHCTMPDGTLRPAGMHLKRKSIHWNEPDNLWILRQRNRQRWRKMQKTMIRAMINIGTNRLGEIN